MSVDKLVDSAQLDSDLTSVANAIRTKGGTSASLAFPADFVTAIAAIPTGGGIDLTEFNKFMGWTDTANMDWSGVTALRSRAMNYAKISNAYFPDVTSAQDYVFNATTITTGSVVLPKVTSIGANGLRGGTGITSIDLGANCTNISNNGFYGNTSFNLLILRSTSVVTLGGTGAFTQTKFANGSTGGTIYIPKSLYDHLGDGGSSDYKAASNWSTVNGYGTVTWAKIEGSQYETAYAEGTTIPT